MAPPVFDHEHFFLGLLLSCMVSASFLGFDSSASSFWKDSGEESCKHQCSGVGYVAYGCGR